MKKHNKYKIVLLLSLCCTITYTNWLFYFLSIKNNAKVSRISSVDEKITTYGVGWDND